MKKVTTLGMVAITIAVSMIPMSSEAAGLNNSGGQKIITINGNCNLQDLQSQLKNAGVNANCANWAEALNQQNCEAIQQLDKININDVLGAQYSNGTCTNEELAEAVKNATAQLNQQYCNNQTQVEVPTESTNETDTTDTSKEATVPETEVTKDTTPNQETTTNTETTNTKAPNTETNTTKNPETQTPSTETSTKSYAQQVVDLVNAERAKEGLAALKIDTNVAKAATVRANEIQTKFEHVRPNGTGFVTALKEQGVTYRGAGENIAWGQKTPQEVVTAWMNSPGHRANIMNPNYVNIGVGNLQNASGIQYWVQIFTY